MRGGLNTGEETMKYCCAILTAAGASIVTISLVGPSAIAGPDQVKFPVYQTHVLYDVLDQPENKEVRELYVNPEALKGLIPILRLSDRLLPSRVARWT